MTDSNVDSLLKAIASSNIRDKIDESYTGVDEAMKHMGGPSNSMLLSAIHDENKRMANEMLRVNSRIVSLTDTMSSVLSAVERLCLLTETQNEILSSNILNKSSEQVTGTNKSKGNGVWYYQATKLTSKFHVYACIISHLINMVQLHMDVAALHYPDSQDCSLNELQNAIRIVCNQRCKIRSVVYKNTIEIKEKDSQPLETILPHISSSDSKKPTTLSESAISNISNQVTRGVMQDIEWIRQRLCHLDGVLSIKQIDILRSIGHPLIKPDSDCELNWDRHIMHPRSSHPLAKDISDLLKIPKDKYIVLRMQGADIYSAYNEAKNYVPPSKK